LTFVFSSAWIDPDEKRTAGLCAREICVFAVLVEIITVQILHVNENIDKCKDKDAPILPRRTASPCKDLICSKRLGRVKRKNFISGV